MAKTSEETNREPANSVAREAWLEEGLTPEEAARFLRTTEDWLQRKRTNPGKEPGPLFSRQSAKNIVYVRRDLIAYRDGRKFESTSEYGRKAPAQAGEGEP